MATQTLSQLVERISAWAERRPDIRALLLTGSYARNQADELSDLDIEMFVTDPLIYAEDDRWMSEIGKVWVYIPERTDDDHPTRLIIFEGGPKVDFTLYPLKVLADQVERQKLSADYELGYRVLLDRDHLAGRLPAPTGRRPTTTPPTEAEFIALVNEFWFEVYHVAKYLRREDLWAAKFRDWTLKKLLLKMVEWHEKSLHGWDYDTKRRGIRMQEWIEPQIWRKLQGVFAHFDAEDSWKSLAALMDMFGEIAAKTAVSLHYPYPTGVDESIRSYVRSLGSEKRRRHPLRNRARSP